MLSFIHLNVGPTWYQHCITNTSKSQQVLAVIMNARTHAFMHTRTFSYHYSLTQHVQTAICWSIAHTHTRNSHMLFTFCVYCFTHIHFSHIFSLSLSITRTHSQPHPHHLKGVAGNHMLCLLHSIFQLTV